MDYVRLGSAGLKVSRVCLGMMSYGSQAERAWHLDEAAAEPIVKAAIDGGLAHFTGLPHVTINGDDAVVISYLQILTPNKSGEAIEVPNHGASRGYHIHRVVTNRWELRRTASGWKIKRRSIRLVDGSEPSREILRGALESYAARA